MAKQKLVVKTDVGTFTRTTARTYSNIVVTNAYRAEWLEGQRVACLADTRALVARYKKTLQTGVGHDDRNEFHRQFTARCIADGSYVKWLAEKEAQLVRLEDQGKIVEDQDTPWEVLGWTGRLDLARKLASTSDAAIFRTVRIYDTTTGLEVK